MSKLDLERFEDLERLSMRQNLFPNIEKIEKLGSHLKELDLYDNRISKFDCLEDFIHLVYVIRNFMWNFPRKGFLPMFFVHQMDVLSSEKRRC
jgi:hypothetical protein